MNRTLPLALAAALSLVACKSSEPAPAAPDTQLQSYKESEIEPTAQTLLKKINATDVELAQVMTRLKQLLAEQEIKAVMAEKSLVGIAAYRGGGGGLILTGSSANGLMCFAGGRQMVPVESGAWSVGANVGGSSSIGVALMFGLDRESNFPGVYRASGTGGTVGEGGYKVGKATPVNGEQVLYWTAAETGFNAQAGGGEIRLAFSPPASE